MKRQLLANSDLSANECYIESSIYIKMHQLAHLVLLGITTIISYLYIFNKLCDYNESIIIGNVTKFQEKILDELTS